MRADAAACTLTLCRTHAHADAPYDLGRIDSLEQLLWAHRSYQEEALANLTSGTTSGAPLPAAVRVATWQHVGLGNRLPSLVTGLAIALLTRRLILIDSSALEHLEPPFPAAWQGAVAAAYANASRCEFGSSDALATLPPAALCGDDKEPAALYTFRSIDYDLPLLQINEPMATTLQRLVPDGEVFWHLSRHLLQPTRASMAAMLPYMKAASGCAVGLQMRSKKHKPLDARQFARIATALARGRNGSVFVAADAGAMLDQVAALLLPQRQVWWTELTRRSVDTTRTRAGNPGTELSAVVDLLLLGRCREIVVTPSSSLGAVAAGLAGVRPVFATFGAHADNTQRHPFLNPWMWRAVTSEPCCFRASGFHHANSSVAARFRDRHPLYFHHSQCHFDVERT